MTDAAGSIAVPCDRALDRALENPSMTNAGRTAFAGAHGRTRLAWIVLVALVAPPAAAEPPTTAIRLDLTRPATYYFRLTLKTEQTLQTDPERPISVRLSQVRGLRWECEPQPDGGAIVRHTFVLFHDEIAGIMPLVYDSRRPDRRQSPLRPAYERLLDHPIPVIYDARARVIGERLDEQFRRDVIEATIPQYRDEVRAMMSGRYLHDLLYHFVVEDAPSPLAPDTTWITRREMPFQAGTWLITDYRFRFTGLREDATPPVALIDVQALMHTEDRAPADTERNITLEIEKGLEAATLEWDLARGLLFRVTGRREIDGAVVSTVRGETTRTPVRIRESFTTERVRLEDLGLPAPDTRPATAPATQPAPR